MTDDLVKRLREYAKNDVGLWGDECKAYDDAADRIEFLEAALLKIHMLSEAQGHHAWGDHATYYRISTAALDGKTDDQ